MVWLRDSGKKMPEDITLSELVVLVLDMQATAADPDKGFLMEAGWGIYRPGNTLNPAEIAVESHLARPPEGFTLSRRVAQLTGVTSGELENGETDEQIWRSLVHAIGQVMAETALASCPVIIHFSRFETPFLIRLHHHYNNNTSFPFDIICTHHIMRRLFPAIPRTGLRAAAGYFGYSAPELRRVQGHVAATAYIWDQLWRRLAELGILTLTELKQWLFVPVTVNRRVKPEFLIRKEDRLFLPAAPGVYRMRRSNGDLLYIGKATSLKQRVNGYFRKKGGHAAQSMEMLTQAARLDITVTDSALEAALLESDEIKMYSPPYNVALRSREQPTAFFSRDLCGYSDKPGEQHVIGPLPSAEVFLPFCAAVELLRGLRAGETDPGLIHTAMGIKENIAPDPQCLRLGLDAFREQHRIWLSTPEIRRDLHLQPLTALMTLGRELHLLALQEEALTLANASFPGPEGEDAGKTPSDAIETEKEWVWTPEAVARALESVIRRGSALVRRARWYTLLSESVLIWSIGDKADHLSRMLILRGAAIVHRATIPQNAEIPVPPGYERPAALRRLAFNTVAYDRMRVLTSELRRLVSSDGEAECGVVIRLAPHAFLNAGKIRKLLRWL